MEFDKTKLRITPSSFREAKELERSIGVALKNNTMNFELEKDLNKDNIGEILKSILSVATSLDVEENLFNCCKRALYNNDKIDLDFFEKIENRPLYYPIMIEIIKVNVLPFIESLFSQFEGLIGITKKSQKQT